VVSSGASFSSRIRFRLVIVSDVKEEGETRQWRGDYKHMVHRQRQMLELETRFSLFGR
jgi:hypothetical protein